MARLGEQLATGAGLDDAAGIHHRHAIAGLRDDAEIVGDEDHAHAELRAQAQEQLQDLVLDGDVERGRRLVGEQQLGLARQRDRDHHALAHAAGELVRIVVEPRARPPECRHGPAARGRACGRRPVERGVGLQVLADLQADGQHRVERRHRLLEDHGDLAPAHLRAARRSGSASRFAPRQSTSPLTCRGGRTSRTIERSVTLLPEPDSPTRPSTSPAPTSRSTPSTAIQRAARACEVTRRPRHARAAARPRSSSARAAAVGEAVAEQAEAEAGDDDRDAGKDRDPPGRRHEVLAVGDQHAPFGRGGCAPRPR